MKLILCKTYEEMSMAAADEISALVASNPCCTLGLATGSTPIGMYRQLINRYKKGEIDFSGVTTFNLDEYYPISRENDQSYYHFMHQNLFDYVNVPKENIHIPNGEVSDPETECQEYENLLTANGQIDLQVLGIGQNGHIGFNEPDSSLWALTHITDLTESTIQANSRFFEKEEDVPKRALTMGMVTILKSKKILLLANGKNKHEAISALLDDRITTSVPATLLKTHPDVVLICDGEAYYG
ncbi:MAG: glucosamine-6-phosphate deaminase [Clostridia bacterium]|nr:glucosamine-6-phosphate deaminase [Clostridia bacterium]